MTVWDLVAQNPPGTDPAITSAAATILVAFISLMGTVGVSVITSRATRKSATSASEIEADKLDAMRVNELRTDLDQLRADRLEDRRLFQEQMSEQREANALEVSQWRMRVLELDERHQRLTARFRELQRWARAIRRLMGDPEVSSAIVITGLPVPPTPRSVGMPNEMPADTDPGISPIQLDEE
jgi:hypothetical protein